MTSAAWEGQFTQLASDPQRPNNLFAPVPGDHGTHGAFDDRARERDWVTQVTTRLGAAGVRLLVLLIAPVWVLVVVAQRAFGRLRTARA